MVYMEEDGTLTADTEEELHIFAASIGVERDWYDEDNKCYVLRGYKKRQAKKKLEGNG